MVAHQASRLKILVVDDEDANLLFLEKSLLRKGHQVILAHTGEEALTLYERVQPDLVLMDVMMPGWDGFETARRIRAGGGSGGRWVPLIFLSAMGRTPDMVKGLAAGGDDYLVKPVDLALLESKIASMQRIAQLQRDLELRNADLAQANAANERQKQTSVKIFSRLMRLEATPQRHIQFRVLPSDVFSGDLVGACEGPDGSIYLLLADAAGHGLDAAATILPLVSNFYTLAERGHPLARIAKGMNQRLHDLLPTQHFVAALLVKVDPARGVLEVLNAGMPAGYLLAPDGSPHAEFRSNYLPFGLQSTEEHEYQPETQFVSPGYQILLCSDGLTESGSECNKPFGMDGVLAAIQTAHSPDHRMAAVLAAYDRHRAGREAKDDVSIAILTIPAWQPAAPGASRTTANHPVTSGAPASFQVDLGPEQIRNPDLLANVVHLLQRLNIVPTCLVGPVFASLKELLANAVDYGLLHMPSRAVACCQESTWRAWRGERRQRLAALTEGRISIGLEARVANDDTPHTHWQLTVTDSGQGFDINAPRPAYGGLARIKQQTAVEPCFNEQGNRVVVQLS